MNTAHARGSSLCEALGLPGIAFRKHDGTPYSEAHHVQPVAAMLDGSLGAHNIMVLCANHHREVHYGRFHVVSENAVAWDIQLGDDHFLIPRSSALDVKT